MRWEGKRAIIFLGEGAATGERVNREDIENGRGSGEGPGAFMVLLGLSQGNLPFLGEGSYNRINQLLGMRRW